MEPSKRRSHTLDDQIDYRANRLAYFEDQHQESRARRERRMLNRLLQLKKACP